MYVHVVLHSGHVLRDNILQGLKPVKTSKFENRKLITAFSFGMLEAVIGYR